jgi:gamma-butyrobetaine dioxygenase
VDGRLPDRHPGSPGQRDARSAATQRKKPYRRRRSHDKIEHQSPKNENSDSYYEEAGRHPDDSGPATTGNFPIRRIRQKEENGSDPPIRMATSSEEDDHSHIIHIRGPGGDISLSSINLRDLCTCSRCVDPSTRQRLFTTAEIPETICAIPVEGTDSTLSFRWKDDVPGYGEDHITTFNRAVLDSIQKFGQVEKPDDFPERVLWDAKTFENDVRNIDYDQYMSDDAVLYKALEALHTHGLIFLQNVPESEASVAKITERIGPLKNTFYGMTWDVRSVPEAKNVAYTAQDLGFHMDLMYMRQPPHLQYLHCIRSSSAGGASLFVDSFRAALEVLHANIEHFRELAYRPVNFHYDHLDSNRYYHYKQFTVRTSHTAYLIEKAAQAHPTGTEPLSPEIRALFLRTMRDVAWSPPFQAPLRMNQKPAEDGQTARIGKLNQKMKKWHAAAAHFNRQIHEPSGIFERMMKPGECVIFDNRRVLHARKAFEIGDGGKERWLRGAYLDKDSYLSKLRVLQHKFNNAVESN